MAKRSYHEVYFIIISCVLVTLCAACANYQAPYQSTTGQQQRSRPAATATAGLLAQHGIAIHPPRQTGAPDKPKKIATPVIATPRPSSPPTVIPTPTSAAPQPIAGVGGAQTAQEQQLVQQLFALINQDRANVGLPPLAWSNILAGTAYQHSICAT